MVIRFSDIDLHKRPTLILKNLDGTPIQILGYASNVEADLSYNEVSEISFTIPSHVNGEATPGYQDVIGMRVVDLMGVGQFLLIDPEETPKNIMLRALKKPHFDPTSREAENLRQEYAAARAFLLGG